MGLLTPFLMGARQAGDFPCSGGKRQATCNASLTNLGQGPTLQVQAESTAANGVATMKQQVPHPREIPVPGEPPVVHTHPGTPPAAGAWLRTNAPRGQVPVVGDAGAVVSALLRFQRAATVFA